MENRLVVGAAMLAVAVGCGGKNKTDAVEPGALGSTTGPVEIPRIDPTLCEVEGKNVAKFDLNKDNRPDIWKLSTTIDEGGTSVMVLTCKQVDLDHDGKKDFVVTYDRSGGVLTEEFDFDFDGRFDARRYYDKKTGKVYLVERDSDYDKKPDIWEKFDKQGVVESVRRDRNGDGKPDVWEQYKEGLLVAILYDDDFDARVDRKDEVKVDAAAAPEPADDGAEPGVEPGVEDEPAPEGDGDDDAGADDAGGVAGL